jgi:hypothetical protein
MNVRPQTRPNNIWTTSPTCPRTRGLMTRPGRTRMSDKSSIEWTEATWNPVTGCAPANGLASRTILVRRS